MERFLLLWLCIFVFLMAIFWSAGAFEPSPEPVPTTTTTQGP